MGNVGEVKDSIARGKVETYRDILTPIVEQNNSEGSGSSGNSFGFGLILVALLVAGIAALCIILIGVPIPYTIAICVVSAIILFEIIPFNVMQRLKDYKRMSYNMNAALKELNGIRSINEDGTISVGQYSGILLECTTNYYMNLNNYTYDFDRFIELFNRFQISITALSNTNPVDYVNIDNMAVYNDRVIQYERIKLAKHARKAMYMKSSVYVFYIFVYGLDEQIDEILDTYREAMNSTYKRVFASISMITGDNVYKIFSRELLTEITRQNVFVSRDKKDTNKHKNVITIKEI